MKFLFWLFVAAISIVLSAIPEGVMYLIYHLIQPQSDLSKIFLLAVFWIGGAAACIAFALMGIALFAKATADLLK